MKEWISILVQIGPIILVGWWMGRGHGHQRKMILRDGGPAVIASGLCTLIGAKFFGMSVVGKKSVSTGDDAIRIALYLMALGVAMFALHYLIFALIPAIGRLFGNEDRRG